MTTTPIQPRPKSSAAGVWLAFVAAVAILAVLGVLAQQSHAAKTEAKAEVDACKQADIRASVAIGELTHTMSTKDPELHARAAAIRAAAAASCR